VVVLEQDNCQQFLPKTTGITVFIKKTPLKCALHSTTTRICMPDFQLSHPAWVEVNLNQFKRNIAYIRQHIGHTRLCLPVKANAYGHGLVAIARAADEAGVDYFAVAHLQEGALLRQANIRKPILVLGAIHEEQIKALLDNELELSIASLYKAQLVAKECEKENRRCKVHVEIDTGMQRTGVRLTTAIDLLNYLYATPCFEVVGVYSHLVTTNDPLDDNTRRQIAAFQHFVTSYIKPKDKKILCHLANSGAVCHFPDAYLDMVRPGLLSFGYYSSPLPANLAKIQPFFSVKAKIAYFKVVEKNQGIGYDHTYTTTADSRIVTVPVGYGDGYRRVLSNRGTVLIRGRRYPIVGTICMDQFMVNIGQDEAYVGEEVVLIGKQGNAEIKLTEVADLCDSIPYEILCGFNDRLPRKLEEEGKS
jgi:alanine racemase